MPKWLNETRLQSLINEIKSRFSKRPTIWSGTKAEWDALTSAEQAQYSVKMITDDETGATVDAVIDGDMRAVTSNAVYDQTVLKNTGSVSIAGSGNISAITMTRRAKIGNYVLLAFEISTTNVGSFEVNNVNISNYISVSIAQWGCWISSTGRIEEGRFYSLGSTHPQMYIFGRKEIPESKLNWFILGIEA